MIRCIIIFSLFILINENSFCQKDSVLQFKDIVIKKKSKRDWGKEIMRKAIVRRQEIEKKYSNFEVDIYSISKIDKEKKRFNRNYLSKRISIGMEISKFF